MSEIQPAEGQTNGGRTLIPTTTEQIATKRQRRPSVRLGDIGVDPPYESHARRNTKSWKLAFDHPRKEKDSGKPSKTRPLTNLTSVADFNETLDGEEREGNIDGTVAIGSWKVKESKKRGPVVTKRARSSWVSRIDDTGGGGGGGGGSGTGVVELEEKYSAAEDVEDGGYREFDMENSESPLKEQSPIHSMENLGIDGHRRSFKSRDHNDGIDLSGPSENDVRNENGGRIRSGEDGIRIWLNGLGLGRYAPVFEVHEVDDEVLPKLTLEDLKDMGINAVGSRRKLFCAIQKLGKGFS
ncbi:unnamed protein product [Vicia faba]|uniref:SAM domain-containing protein n=1 Tax=Vicia faba TaxID=3906 RepID=A0AAV1BEJ6_VICFA|nr:unnamed protein product [Vicia faba]